MSNDDGSPPPPGIRHNDIRDDYDDEFGAVRSPEEIARRWLLIPGIAYLLLGILGVHVAGFVLFLFLYHLVRHGFDREPWVNNLQLSIITGSLGAFLWSVLIFAGGISILNGTRFRLAIAGTVAVIALGVFGFYFGILGFPFGVFALILLVRPEGRKLFGQSEMEFTPELARQRMRIPSLWMTRIAVILIPAALVGAVILASYSSRNYLNKLEWIAMILGMLATPVVIAFLVWIAFTGKRMGNLQRRKSCLVAAYALTCFSLVPFWGIFVFPFGIWALVWLHHPGVRRFFDQPETAPSITTELE